MSTKRFNPCFSGCASRMLHKNRRQKLLILLIINFIFFPIAAAISFSYSIVSNEEVSFNNFKLNISSSAGLTPQQINNAINISGEKSSNIIVTSVVQIPTGYLIYGRLINYDQKKNKLFNPWFNSSWESKEIYNVSENHNGTPINISTQFNKSDRWINETDLRPLPFWNETNSKVYINVTWNGSGQIAKYINNTNYFNSISNGVTTFDYFPQTLSEFVVTGSATYNPLSNEYSVVGTSGWGTQAIQGIQSFQQPYVFEMNFTPGELGGNGYVALSDIVTAPTSGYFEDYFEASNVISILPIIKSSKFNALENYSIKWVFPTTTTGGEIYINNSLYGIGNLDLGSKKIVVSVYNGERKIKNIRGYKYNYTQANVTLFGMEAYNSTPTPTPTAIPTPIENNTEVLIAIAALNANMSNQSTVVYSSGFESILIIVITIALFIRKRNRSIK